MYVIEAHWEVGRGSRPAHVFHLNGRPISGRASDVCKEVVGPQKSVVSAACVFAKTDGPVELYPTLAGWRIRKPK